MTCACAADGGLAKEWTEILTYVRNERPFMDPDGDDYVSDNGYIKDWSCRRVGGDGSRC
jgi:hypothetical protein